MKPPMWFAAFEVLTETTTESADPALLQKRKEKKATQHTANVGCYGDLI